MRFIGALALDGMKVFAQEYETVDADSMIAFFMDLDISLKAKTIHVICDNGSSNKNKKVEEYLQTSRIKIHYLTPIFSQFEPNRALVEGFAREKNV